MPGLRILHATVKLQTTGCIFPHGGFYAFLAVTMTGRQAPYVLPHTHPHTHTCTHTLSFHWTRDAGTENCRPHSLAQGSSETLHELQIGSPSPCITCSATVTAGLQSKCPPGWSRVNYGPKQCHSNQAAAVPLSVEAKMIEICPLCDVSPC